MANKNMYSTVMAFVIFLAGFFGGAVVADVQNKKYAVKDERTCPHVQQIAQLKAQEIYLVGRLHALHGIDSSEYKGGEYSFWRNGKKNKL